MNGHAQHAYANGVKGRQVSGTPAPGEMDIPFRGPRGSLKRALRADGATVLTQNANYTVKMLPSTPKELKREGLDYRGSLCATTSQALAITREKAFVWDYTAHTAVSSVKALDLPSSVRAGELLPFGALVTSGSTTDTGLVLIAPSSGKIVFHESFERATSMGLFQERKEGVEGALAGIFSGEAIVDFVSADAAGFIVLLSSGRVAHLSLRDAQGKPKIQSRILSSTEHFTGGIFGSIKGLLGTAAWRQAVTAVRTRSLERGQVQVLALVEKGELRVWDLDWSGRYDYKANIDFRDALMTEFKDLQPVESQAHVEELAVLDFAILERAGGSEKMEIATSTTDKPLEVLLLVRVGSADIQSCFLAELALAGPKCTISRVLEVRGYLDSASTTTKPRLQVPKPGHTAYVVLQNTTFLVALSDAGSDPEAQLHEASYVAPEAFEDAIHLRRDKDLAFLQAAAEDGRSSKDSSCIMFVMSAGLVRITATNANDDPERSSIPVKSRIEQAIFYGTQDGNILDLSRRPPQDDSLDEVEEAAMAISDEILRSGSTFIHMPPRSIEANLNKRGQALEALANHLRKTYPPLSRKTRWQLLSDAEKIAAGKALWPKFEAQLVDASKDKRRSTLLHEISQWLQQAHPFDLLSEQVGPDDQVRTLFVTQLGRLEKLLPWARQILQALQDDGKQSSENMLRLISEANDIWLCCLEMVFDFRANNADSYGIRPSTLEEGILNDPADAVGITEFWTSSDAMLKEVVKMTTLSRDSAELNFDTDQLATPSGYLSKIALENSRLVQLCCLIYRERITWCYSRDSAKYQDQAHKLESAFETMRYQQTRALAEVGQTEAGLKLAEKYGDMHTLTEMIVGESQYLLENRETCLPSEAPLIDAELEKISSRVKKYFEQYGDAWSNAFFGVGFSGGQAGNMLAEGQAKWGRYLSQYLHNEQARAKICWINDITKYQDFRHACADLSHAGEEQETGLWNKKVELSMAKLAMLAACEGDGGPDNPNREEFLRLSREGLKLVEVQERLYRHILPEILHCIDYDAEVQVAVERFASGVKKHPTLVQLLRAGLSKLLAHKTLPLEELIDVLTLMEHVTTVNDETDLHGLEMFEALVALNAAAPSLSPKRFDTLLKVVWKRAFLADDWEKIGAEATKRSDHDVRAVLARTVLHRTLFAARNNNLISTAEGSYVRTLQPGETLGAGCEPGDVAPGFFGREFLDDVLGENVRMDRALEAAIGAHGLDGWWADIEANVDFVLQSRAEMEMESAKASREEAESVDGHGSGVNGLTNGIKVEDEEDVTGISLYHGDEDVEMEQ